MRKIDWSRFKFITRKNEWFVEGTEAVCLSSYCESEVTDIIEDNSGLFKGLTNETFTGYDGVYPREDEDSCSFGEFDIYFENVLVNDITYEELFKLMENN